MVYTHVLQDDVLHSPTGTDFCQSPSLFFLTHLVPVSTFSYFKFPTINLIVIYPFVLPMVSVIYHEMYSVFFFYSLLLSSSHYAILQWCMDMSPSATLHSVGPLMFRSTLSFLSSILLVIGVHCGCCPSFFNCWAATCNTPLLPFPFCWGQLSL